MPPNELVTTMDYRPALLWLMGELGSGKTAQVIQEFEKRYANLIPDEHYETNNSGNTKWVWAVQWSRQDLYTAGLMGSGGKGLWTITEEGRKWLDVYPDGGKQKLLELIYQTKKIKYGKSKNKLTSPKAKKKRKVSGSERTGTDEAIENAHSLLDKQIYLIQNFLHGRSAIRPSDEQLCDWVQFCYNFNLYYEGWEIFKYIDQKNTEAWHYKRTKRYAQVCRTKL